MLNVTLSQQHKSSSTQSHVSTLHASKLHLQVAAARLQQLLSICGSRCQQQQHVCKALSSREDAMLESAPFFDEPARQPTEEEAFAVATGSSLTPEQQLAKKLQLPLTLRIRLPPKAPTERQLMSQIQAAATWQELEAIVYQQRAAAPAGRSGTAASSISSTEAPSNTSKPLPASADGAGQQQQQAHDDDVTVQPLPQKRRRQQPKPLSVPVQSTATPKPDQEASEAVSTGPAEAAGPGSSSSASLGIGSSYSMSQLAASALQPEVAKPSPLLNHLHTTEAFRRLVQLLPSNPRQLKPNERSRAAALIDFLSLQALAHAKTLEIDPRGIAHVAHALSKLGQKNGPLMAELQEAALIEVQGFKGQYVAMLLGALVGLGMSPEQQLLQALTQHIISNRHLFKHQSMANTIWALAKLSIGSNRAGEAGASTAAAHAPAPGAFGGSSATSSSSSSSSAAGRCEVQQELVQVLVQRCHPQMHFWMSGHLAQAAWGLARLGAKPDEAWCKSLLLASRKRLHKMPPRDLANIIAALPALGAVPDQEWLDAFCTTSAAKLRHSEAMGVYSILFGLVRLKQQQRRQQGKAKAKCQPLQQQRQGLQQQQQGGDAATSVPQGEAAVGAVDQPAAPASEAAAVEADGVLGATGTGAAAPSAAGVKVLSAAEVKLLRAAAMWLERLQSSLTPQQLAGVITSLAELLPAEMLQQAAAAAAQQQGCAQQMQGELQDDQRKEQQLIASLAVLLPSWRVAVEEQHLVASLPKKQAKFFGVAWGRIRRHFPDHQSQQ